MKMEKHVPLDRQFLPVPKSQEEAENDEIRSVWGHIKPQTWDDLDREFRSVILAEAGAGKTEEMRNRALLLADQGKPSFFIRIEDIDVNFSAAFEVGNEHKFTTWLESAEEAWFFLDSVDEARLENPNAFGKALRRFSKGINKGAHRAHIYLSGRPYAWRPREDRRFLNEILFMAATQKENVEAEDQASEVQSALTIYVMRPLEMERIRRFCIARSVTQVDHLLKEIERTNLWSLAERPFDLEGIIAKWADDGALGGRTELLRHNIDRRLRDDHNVDRAQQQPINIEHARKGARRLAAAVVLSGQVGINVPDTAAVKPGIEAESVLAEWNPNDVRALLERGIFNDIIYGAVRFRHRDVRELLAAEWFDGLLKSGGSRKAVESLFFREKYGEKIVAPRLRPVLSWLILFDEEIRRRALDLHPEIAVEGGDPSLLPLTERRRILTNIVNRIVSDQDDRSARDNAAVARIANVDLSVDTLQLVDTYKDNDDAIFFLGRLVWQGEMVACVAPFVDFATNGSRGIYARIASVRAIMNCGTTEQKQHLWEEINKSNTRIPRELLSEILDAAEPNSYSAQQFLLSLEKLAPYKRFSSSGLSGSIHSFVERLPIAGNEITIAKLIDGLIGFLERPPYFERRECRVSKDYAWLLSPATHVVERLVTNRSDLALEPTVVSIMLMVPALRHWHDGDLNEYKGNLDVLVPGWPELNDALYWASINQARAAKVGDSKNEPITDDWSVSWLGHYWSFDATSLPRLFDYMQSRALEDDRLVALSTAFRVYAQTGRSSDTLDRIEATAFSDMVLRRQLEVLVNPPVSEAARRYDEQHAEYLRKHEEKERQNKQSRDLWISELRANPDRVRNPPNLALGDCTNDHVWLLHELLGNGLKTSRSDGANWRALILDFGDDVALAYRDAAVKHWRHYLPTLQSEGVIRNSSIPYSLIFALAGLEIEAAEQIGFPKNLSKLHVLRALRYITWELNGFPSWLELMYQAFPSMVTDAVIQELRWELENTGPNESSHYILHDLVYHATWLHTSIAPFMLEWVGRNPGCIHKNMSYCLRILVNSGVDPIKLAELAYRGIAQAENSDQIARWFALRVDCDPAVGIPELEIWLSGLDEEGAKHAAETFIAALMGGRHVRDGGSHVGRFRTAEHLKSLYVLMHKYVRAKEDIDRANGGVYSPQLRDDAQDARNRLFSLLLEIPGKASYVVIKQLIDEHPDTDSRPWMAKRARQRAEEDGDLEPWTAEQVSDFDKLQAIIPATHRQLFDLGVQRLIDLKGWLEQGNDSPWQTWQRANEETEMRRLFAGWLNQQCLGRYTTAQESEIANNQRMDIWLHNTKVHSPVPIELKLLDKNWSGPKLCERLRNQLVGDYLREENAGCGVMLLVSQKTASKKRWRVNGRLVGLHELTNELKEYWQGISDQFPGVQAIDVIVIDLTLREQVSDA